MSLTIKELADELAVSKTAIRKHMDDEFRSTYTIKQGNKILIKDKGVDVLKEQFKNSESSTENSTENKATASADSSNGKDTTALLAETLEDQRKQIEEKDKQIRELHQLLDQSQRLQLDVQNKLKQLQNKMGNSSETKAIEENVTDQSSDNQTQSEGSTQGTKVSDNYRPDQILSSDGSGYQAAPKKKKHWWQFGR
ncbi:replication protein B [Lentilactobacillus raoultii]|uniref:Replication protein B n=1 Tax=Lentilactobacillus raoultii TaxID=1987503 RepID=A0ABW3PIU9_9LACO|nr:replication protein B [Lentilactobacillus raoultii]